MSANLGSVHRVLESIELKQILSVLISMGIELGQLIRDLEYFSHIYLHHKTKINCFNKVQYLLLCKHMRLAVISKWPMIVVFGEQTSII